MDYKVTKNDLKGELDGFPIEVVQKMVDSQVEQGNKANVKLFQESSNVGKMGGGFSWSETKEGRVFWDEVINDYRFDYFFAMFPKKYKPSKQKN